MPPKIKKQTQNIEIVRFTTDNVLTTKELESMSNGEKKKHIEELEQICLQLDNGLTIAIEQLNKKVRAMNGELL